MCEQQILDPRGRYVCVNNKSWIQEDVMYEKLTGTMKTLCVKNKYWIHEDVICV
jgi:hypothetical protein